MKLWHVLVTYACGQQIEFFTDHDPYGEFNGAVMPDTFCDTFGRWVKFDASVKPLFVMVQSLDNAGECKKQIAKLQARQEMRARHEIGEEMRNDPLKKLTGADGQPIFK